MKVLIICFDYKESNIRLQPWRYIYEISRGMVSRNIEVEIISDGYPALNKNDEIDGVIIHRLRQLRSLPFMNNNEFIWLINTRSPDVIIWTMGATSFYYNTTLKTINKPIIGIWMSTTYSIKQIIDLGLEEILRNFSSIYLFVINALIPSFLIKSMLTQSSLKKLIVLNNNAKKMLVHYGASTNKVSVIPPGINNYDLELPDIHEIENLNKKMQLNKKSFVILYLGSPLSLRGIDTVIKAISIIDEKIPQLKFIILSRRRFDSLIEEENYITDFCKKQQINNRTHIISGFLNREDIKNYILLSDIIALPFKIVQSDTPTSILEVMALGKPIISTRIDGIPELLDNGRGLLIDPNDPEALADAILTLYLHPELRKDMGERAREYMLRHPTWYQTTHELVTMIGDIKPL